MNHILSLPPVQGPATRHPVNHDALADFLKALAYPARLQILGRLRSAKTLSEIAITPKRGDDKGSPGRKAARQTVQAHLDKLVDAGLVQVHSVERQGREMPAYVADPSRLYAVMEELRSLIVQYEGRGLGPDQTATVGRRTHDEPPRGPRLVLVHGVYEGRTYPLDRETQVDGGWHIGRRPGLSVALDYDPYVSQETAVVTLDEKGYAVTDLGSKNGTWLNWSLLEPNETRRLTPGDIIGVGRSLLGFTDR